MSDAQGAVGVYWGGWGAYTGVWPTGDTYSLTPVWSEWHAEQGLTCSCKGEENLIHNYCLDAGMPFDVTLTLTDLGDDLTTAADDTPATGYVRTDSTINRDWGWAESLSFDAEPVLDDADAWTGQVKISLDPALHPQLGLNQPWSYFVRCVLNDGLTDYVVRVLAGVLVVKP